MKFPVERLAVSINEASRMIGVSRMSIYAALAEGELVGRKFGKRTLILISDLERYLQDLPIATVDEKNARGRLPK